MTNEGESDTVKWVADKGAKYAYAYDRGDKLKRFFGVSGIPAAALVDAKGKVIWQGHPSSLDESVIAKAVSGALPKPLWEWSAAAKGVKNALLKRQYKTALDEAAKLSEADSGPSIKAAIESIVASRAAELKTAYSKGDFLSVETNANALVKELEGLPEKADAVQVLADLKANAEAVPVLKAQRQIAKIAGGELRKRKEIDAAIEDLTKIQKSVAGTFAAEQAGELITRLRMSKNKS